MGISVTATEVLTCDCCGKHEANPQLPGRKNDWFSVFRGGFGPSLEAPDAIFCLFCINRLKGMYSRRFDPRLTPEQRKEAERNEIP